MNSEVHICESRLQAHSSLRKSYQNLLWIIMHLKVNQTCKKPLEFADGGVEHPGEAVDRRDHVQEYHRDRRRKSHGEKPERYFNQS